ncbi:MAG: hypothetical protein KDD37_02380, partial [Bdellovibrionales bacterium]|nr:hypothetical protein [Bdellovibrionales bacterium]
LPDMLPPVLNSSIIIKSKDSELLRVSWSKETSNSAEILMTSSKINETFLVEAKEWKGLMQILEGDRSWMPKEQK